MSRKGTSAGSHRAKMKVTSKVGASVGARSVSTRAGTRANSRGKSQVQHSRSGRPTKSGGGWFGYVFVTLITFGVIFSDMSGPFKGWLRPDGLKPEEKPGEAVKEAPRKLVSEKPKPTPKEETKPKEVFKADIRANLTAEEVEEADKERLKSARLKELIEQFSADIKKPIYNKRVSIRMKDGRKVTCVVTKKDGRELYLEKIEPYNGKMRVDVARLDDNTKMMYFGDGFVKVKARKQLEREDSQGLFDKDPATESGFFNTEEEPTPEDMIHAVREVGEWLQFQAKRGNASAVLKVTGKKNSSRARVLYLYVSRAFLTMSKNDKTTWLEAVRQFWALRCKSNGIAAEANAHVCLVLDGRNIVIGGTKEEDSKLIWFKKLRR